MCHSYIPPVSSQNLRSYYLIATGLQRTCKVCVELWYMQRSATNIVLFSINNPKFPFILCTGLIQSIWIYWKHCRWKLHCDLSFTLLHASFMGKNGKVTTNLSAVCPRTSWFRPIFNIIIIITSTTNPINMASCLFFAVQWLMKFHTQNS